MGLFTVNTSDSKMLYGCIRQSIFLLEKAQSLRDNCLKKMFPNINNEWNEIEKILEFGISRKIAWTGMSMTKSDTVPDDTRVPPNVEMNQATIKTMYEQSLAIGIDLSSNYIFWDPENNYYDSMATWQNAIAVYIEIISLLQEVTLYKIVGGDVEVGETTFERSPAQLIIFDQVEIPMVIGGRFSNKFNQKAIQRAFGNFYDDFFFKTSEALFKENVPTINNYNITTINISPQDDGDGKAEYPISISSSLNLIGVLSILIDDVYYNNVEYISENDALLSTNILIGDAKSGTAKIFTISIS